MWTEIITTAVSAAVSGLISWRVAKISSRAEITKLRETWNHEKEVTADTEFDDMVKAISEYQMFPEDLTVNDAIRKITVYRSKATGDLARVVDELEALFTASYQNPGNIRAKLDEAIEMKRKSHG